MYPCKLSPTFISTNYEMRRLQDLFLKKISTSQEQISSNNAMCQLEHPRTSIKGVFVTPTSEVLMTHPRCIINYPVSPPCLYSFTPFHKPMPPAPNQSTKSHLTCSSRPQLYDKLSISLICVLFFSAHTPPHPAHTTQQVNACQKINALANLQAFLPYAHNGCHNLPWSDYWLSQYRGNLIPLSIFECFTMKTWFLQIKRIHLHVMI